MTRPEWVEAGASRLRSGGIAMGEGDYSWEPTDYGIAEAVLDAVEPLIRADERGRMAHLARVVPGGGIRDWAHAEAVAARLVEVICDLDWALRTEEEVANGFLAERDAARAEVAALRKQVLASEVADEIAYDRFVSYGEEDDRG